MSILPIYNRSNTDDAFKSSQYSNFTITPTARTPQHSACQNFQNLHISTENTSKTSDIPSNKAHKNRRSTTPLRKPAKINTPNQPHINNKKNALNQPKIRSQPNQISRTKEQQKILTHSFKETYNTTIPQHHTIPQSKQIKQHHPGNHPKTQHTNQTTPKNQQDHNQTHTYFTYTRKTCTQIRQHPLNQDQTTQATNIQIQATISVSWL
jgi:hypothetical protein